MTFNWVAVIDTIEKKRHLQEDAYWRTKDEDVKRDAQHKTDQGEEQSLPAFTWNILTLQTTFQWLFGILLTLYLGCWFYNAWTIGVLIHVWFSHPKKNWTNRWTILFLAILRRRLLLKRWWMRHWTVALLTARVETPSEKSAGHKYVIYRNIAGTVRTEVDNVVAAVRNRVHETILIAFDNVGTTTVEMALRSFIGLSGRTSSKSFQNIDRRYFSEFLKKHVTGVSQKFGCGYCRFKEKQRSTRPSWKRFWG